MSVIRRIHRQSGALMIEVLVTIMIVTLGLLGIAALFARSQQMGDEAFQRFQALHIAHQLGEALSVNRAEAARGNASDYLALVVDASYVLKGSSIVQADMAVFQTALVTGGSTKDPKLALTDAIGCITYNGVDRDPTNPLRYQISVAWRGRQDSGAPIAGSSNCGVGSYGAADTLRRVVSIDVQVL